MRIIASYTFEGVCDKARRKVVVGDPDYVNNLNHVTSKQRRSFFDL